MMLDRGAEMAVATTWSPVLASSLARPAEDSLPCWYAAYTCANHEKRVAEQLRSRSVEHFLALYETVRRWKDRRKQLELPLFPGYIFVRLPLSERLRVLELLGVAHLVGFNSQPAAIPDSEVEALRSVLRGGLRAEPHPYLAIGQHMRVTRGPLKGCEGTLVRKKGLFFLVLSINLIQRGVAVEVDSADAESV